MNAMPTLGQAALGAVDVVDIASPGLRTWRGRVEAEQDGQLALVLDDPAGSLQAGAAVVVDWRASHHPRVVATVISADHPHYQVLARKQVARDRRVFPRLMGGIAVRCRRIGPDEDMAAVIDQFLATGTAPAAAGEAWFEPDPLMNFSVNGLRFEDQGHLDPGDTVLCEVGLSSGTERWRTAGLVMRRVPVDADLLDTPSPEALVQPPPVTHHIALMFSDPPEGLTEALAAYTLQLQRLALLAG